MLTIVLALLNSGLASAQFAPPPPSQSCNHVSQPVIVSTILCTPDFSGGHNITVDIYESVECKFPERFHAMYRNSSTNYTANGVAHDGDFGGGGKEILFLRTRESNFLEDYLSIDRTLITQPAATGKLVEIFGVGPAGHALYSCKRIN